MNGRSHTCYTLDMKNSLGAYRLLQSIFRVIDSSFRFDVNKKGFFTTQQEKRSFRYLKDAGYVHELKSRQFEVTELAQINFLKELVSKRNPDGKLRIVMFDIPEKLKRSRNIFRRHLVDLGFKMKQQSVWVSKLPCDDLVAKVVKYHRLKKYVVLVVGETRALL